MPTVLLSAGDVSGDLHAAGLVRALAERRPDCRFLGLGGAAMAAAGVEIVAEQEALALGGLLELASGAGGVARAWRKLLAALVANQPDLVVLVDSGGFNIPFARRVRRHSRAPILYYVAPQVWAWRRGRIRKLARRIDRMAVIFPFEPAVYAGSRLRVDFVGHPLVDELAHAAAHLKQSEARERLGLSARAPLVALFPGSRRNEIQHQLALQLEAARLLQRRRPGVEFVMVLAPGVAAELVQQRVAAAGLPAAFPLRLLEGRSHEAIRAADVALAKPGTITVELMLLECPMVVMGRANPLTAALLRRMVRVPWLAMPNLIAGEPIVPELMQRDAVPETLAQALDALFEGPARQHQLARLAAASRRLGGGGAARAASCIAEEMLGTAAP